MIIRNYFSLFILLSSINAKAQTAIEIEKEAMTLFFQNKYDYALEKINVALKLDSTNSVFFDDRSCINEKIGRYKEAYSDNKMALLLDPKNVYAYLHKANFLLNELKYKESVHTLLDGLKYCKAGDSIKFNFYNTLGVAYSFLNDYPNSISAYQFALQLEPDNTDVLVNFASIQNKSGNKDEAIKTLINVIRIDSSKSTAYNNLGMRYLEIEDYQKAITSFNKSISLTSTNGISYNNRGFCYYKLGKLDIALNDVNTSIHLAPSNPYAFRNRALIYVRQKKKSLACEDLKKAEELGYSKMYDNQVIELIKINCNKK